MKVENSVVQRMQEESLMGILLGRLKMKQLRSALRRFSPRLSKKWIRKPPSLRKARMTHIAASMKVQPLILRSPQIRMKKSKESRLMKPKQQVVKQVPKAYSLILKRKHQQQVSSLQKKRNLPNRTQLKNSLLE